jgi:hypothetical protein
MFTTTVFCVGSTYVKGYTRKNGTYVNGYYRTKSNNTVKDNFSYSGNYNTYTGKTGTNKYKTKKSSDYYSYPSYSY